MHCDENQLVAKTIDSLRFCKGKVPSSFRTIKSDVIGSTKRGNSFQYFVVPVAFYIMYVITLHLRENYF